MFSHAACIVAPLSLPSLPPFGAPPLARPYWEAQLLGWLHPDNLTLGQHLKLVHTAQLLRQLGGGPTGAETAQQGMGNGGI